MARELIITVETVTPLFLGGAKARELAETIRPASIRGQVRYWLRAMLGRSVRLVEDLQQAEGALMGNTEAGSPVRFQVRSGQPLAFAEKSDDGRTGGRMMLPHRAVVGDSRTPLRERAFVEEQRFDIILSPRPGRYTIPNEVVAATLLWLHLGGLGKRSRRGFGSLQPVKCAASEGVLPPEAREHLPNGRPADAAALRKQIGDLLAWVAGLAPASAAITPPAPFSVLHEDVAGVRVSDAITGYNLTSYHQAMVPFWKESLRVIGSPKEKAFGHTEARRASPFHFHIARGEADYYQVFTTFWADPLPDGDPTWTKVGKLLVDVESKFGAANLWGRAS